MFNLLVTGAANAWNGRPYEYDFDRVVREHTKAEFSEKFKSLGMSAVDELMSLPALFAYEKALDAQARIGWITNIGVRGRAIRVEYEIEPTIPPIAASVIADLEWDLEIDEWEMHRTHWAVKDADLLPVLLEAGAIEEERISAQPKDSRVIRLGFAQATSEILARPSVFQVPPDSEEKNIVSVMMPYGAEFDQVFDVIKDACQSWNYRCYRVDNIWETSQMMQNIFSLLYRSDIVICDFSERNPNVFYETGIAHVLGKPVIPILRNENEAPFDMQHHRFIKYSSTDEGLTELQIRIARRIRTLMNIFRTRP